MKASDPSPVSSNQRIRCIILPASGDIRKGTHVRLELSIPSGNLPRVSTPVPETSIVERWRENYIDSTAN